MTSGQNSTKHLPEHQQQLRNKGTELASCFLPAPGALGKRLQREGSEAAPVTQQPLPLCALPLGGKLYEQLLAPTLQKNQTKYSQVCSHEPALSW